jgi:hypothetical protein
MELGVGVGVECERVESFELELGRKVDNEIYLAFMSGSYTFLPPCSVAEI